MPVIGWLLILSPLWVLLFVLACKLVWYLIPPKDDSDKPFDPNHDDHEYFDWP